MDVATATRRKVMIMMSFMVMKMKELIDADVVMRRFEKLCQ
jgi:hypothetical protein